MKYTVLELTQHILSAMDSDEVNSIHDTVESYQVAELLRGVFYDLAVVLNLPEHETLFELNASGDPSKPVLMTVPENVSKIHWIKYDNREDGAPLSDMRDVNFVIFDDMRERQQAETNEMDLVLHGESFPVRYANDKHPQWWTSVDDHSILFDSYDASVDATLQKSKTMCHGVMYPLFVLEDDFIPPLDPSGFSLFRNKAKVRAFGELKQVANAEAAEETRRQMIVNQKRKRTVSDVPPIFKAPRYGRNSWPMSGRVLTFKTRMGS